MLNLFPTSYDKPRKYFLITSKMKVVRKIVGGDTYLVIFLNPACSLLDYFGREICSLNKILPLSSYDEPHKLMGVK